MTQYTLRWAEVALEQYISLSAEFQGLIDERIAELLDVPDGPGCGYEPSTDHWTTTDRAGRGLIVYVFRLGHPRLVVLRIVY